jgi:hypothetical protein
MMQPNSLSPPFVLIVALTALIGGCVYPASSTCSDGRLCPASTRCDDERHLCVSDAQEQACAGLDEGAECRVALAPGTCHTGLCLLFRCGDGMRTGTESCDGADLGGKTCSKLGYYDQTSGLACAADCTFDTSGCTGLCGDGKINGKEACDGDDLGGATCKDSDFYDEPGLRCSAFCTLDVSACTGFCGDGKVNGPDEACDGAPPLGDTCSNHGRGRGLVGCSALCTPDLSGCSDIGWNKVLGGAFNDRGEWRPTICSPSVRRAISFAGTARPGRR